MFLALLVSMGTAALVAKVPVPIDIGQGFIKMHDRLPFTVQV
jgi:hypothetical protein